MQKKYLSHDKCRKKRFLKKFIILLLFKLNLFKIKIENRSKCYNGNWFLIGSHLFSLMLCHLFKFIKAASLRNYIATDNLK